MPGGAAYSRTSFCMNQMSRNDSIFRRGCAWQKVVGIGRSAAPFDARLVRLTNTKNAGLIGSLRLKL